MAGAVFGALVGLIPLYLANRKGQRTLGIIALVVCAGAGFRFELIGALVACVACTVAVLFLVKPKETPTD